VEKINKPKIQFQKYSGFRNAFETSRKHSTEDYVALLYREAALRKQDPAVNGIATETMAFNKITEPEKAGYLIMKYLDDQPTDWLDEGLRYRGTMQNYQLSASGGDKNLKILFRETT
jgi:hypothetical protein